MWPVCLSTWKNVFFNAYEAGRQCAVATREAGLRRLEKQPAYQKENMKSHSCTRAVNHAWLFVSLSLQVCRCSPSSPKGNRRAVLAAIARLKTATCSRPWTNTGTRTVSNVPAVTAAWGRWAPPSTRKPTSSSVAGTTWGKKDTHTHTHTITFLHSQQTQEPCQSKSCDIKVCVCSIFLVVFALGFFSVFVSCDSQRQKSTSVQIMQIILRVVDVKPSVCCSYVLW